ncbi:MAG: helix-turn-helix domain-containing protein [Planctomycetota bacterium]|nr:MAG: helix-turn-helix domain-containing protein [Planctomycetota bacterium]
MASDPQALRSLHNSLRQHRQRRGWSQAELAQRAGLSRSGVSAIEQARLVPSTTAALALAAAFQVPVEALFTLDRIGATASPDWAWKPKAEQASFWQARVGERWWRYPVESTFAGWLPHDCDTAEQAPPTVVVAGCDPAVALLASALERSHSFRLLPFNRSSRAALELLRHRCVHLAGLHLGDNAAVVRRLLGPDFVLIRVATWEEGLALDPALGLRTVGGVLQADLRWVGRESGSGARRCLDKLWQDRNSKPQLGPHLASDHFGVASTIQSGWAQVGVCVRMAAVQAGLDFIPLEQEAFDFCARRDTLEDPPVKAVIEALRSKFFHRQAGAVPGYETREAGEIRSLSE